MKKIPKRLINDPANGSEFKGIKCCVTALSAAVMMGLPQLASAQLEEVIVTAQKRSENLQEIPVSIQVTTQEQLNREQVYNLLDLQRVTSSVEIVPAASGERTGGARIRGIGTVLNGSDYTTTGSVAVVVDDVPMGALTFPQLFDMAQVEVLRGPQGTLFGQTASAGVINVTSVSPHFDGTTGNLGIAYSSKGKLGSEYGKTQIRGGLNMPINDHSALRIAGQWNQDTGVQTNVWLGKDNVQTTGSIRGTYLNEVSEDFTLRFAAEYQKIQEDGVNFYQWIEGGGVADDLAACGVHLKPEGQEYCAENRTDDSKTAYGFSLKLDWDLDIGTLTSISSYRDRVRSRGETDYEGIVGSPIRPADYKTDNPATQWTQELRIVSPDDSAFNYVAGVYLDDYQASQEPFSSNLPLGDPMHPVGFFLCPFPKTGSTSCPGFLPQTPSFTYIDAEMKSWAAFLDGNLDITDKVNLFAGVRYTKSDATTGRSYANSREIDKLISESWNNVSGRLGVRLTPTDDSMYYASVSTGYKTGAIVLPGNPAGDPVVLDPEQPIAYEIGTKQTMLDNRMSFNATVFYVQHDNYQARTTLLIDGNLESISTNVPDVKAKGIEIDIKGSISDNLTANLGYTFNDMTYPDNYYDSNDESLSGKQLAYAPKHKLVLGGEYFKVVNDNGLEGFVNLNVVYKDDTRLIELADDRYVYPSHWTVGGSIGVRTPDEHWKLTLYGRNLTGEDEPFAYLDHPTGGLRAWTAGSTTLREVGASLDYSF